MVEQMFVAIVLNSGPRLLTISLLILLSGQCSIGFHDNTPVYRYDVENIAV